MNKHTNIEVRTFHQMQRHNPSKHLLLDVREPEEYIMGHIPGSVNVPLSDFTAYIPKIPCDQQVVVVCGQGIRSGIAARYLDEAGYDVVYNLIGGVSEWMQRGLDIEI
ncbi:MAG: rhodanese-like domain-containing protein [Anaerolineae bacterium]|nr:rhodanese-like domain-containing protein [Anaerolineae bacterium]